MKPLNLRHIEMNAHFGQSEHTHMTRILKSSKLTLTRDDVVALVSRTRTQVRFVYDYDANNPGVLASLNLRLVNGQTWNPLMLSNYAASRNLKLLNFPRFEDFFHKATSNRYLNKSSAKLASLRKAA